MPPAEPPIARLRRLAAKLAGEGDADAIWFAAAMRVYEAGAPDGLSLDSALGLVPSPGCRPWWDLERRARRDAIIVEIRDRFFPGLANRRAGSLIAERVRRYETTSWRSDRLWRVPPPTYARQIEALLFGVLKLGPSPSPRTIERVLAMRHELPPFGGASDLRSPAEEVTDALNKEAKLDSLA
jgi:hypothetical protein